MLRAEKTQNRSMLMSGRARQRGSTILLVVAALVLSMLMGLAYMSAARQDRRSTRTMGLIKDVDQVEQSVLSKIQDVLREDLGHEKYEAGGETFYDFFVDRAADRGTFYRWDRPGIDYPGELQPGVGDAHSPWLASKAPLVFDPANRDTPQVAWPQITRLTGEYVDAEGWNEPYRQHFWDRTANAPVGSGGVEDLAPVDDPVYLTLETMADATGDGILDSRWERAPLFSLNGVDYFMAVRIVDNSAMANANTAFSQVGLDGQYEDANYEEGLRWAYPTELDLGSLAYRYGTLDSDDGASDYMAEMERLLDSRFVAAGPTSMPTSPEEGAEDYWQHYHGELRTADRPQLAIDSEFSLRHRGGLRNRQLESGIESVDDGLPLLLRNYAQVDYDDGTRLNERNYRDALDNIITDLGAVPPHATGDPLVDYFELNPRGQVTTVSGASQHLKWDLKTLLQKAARMSGGTNDTVEVPGLAAPVPAIDQLIQIIWDTYHNDDLATVVDAPAIPRSLREHASWAAHPADEDRLAAFAAQYAVNLVAFAQGGIDEYEDADPAPNGTYETTMPRYVRTVSDSTEVPHYGLIPLPYVAEAYTQQKYRAGTPGPAPDPTQEMVTWDAVGETGYVIEIRNPHNRPVRMDTVRVVVDGNDWGLLSEMTEATYLEAEQTVMLVRQGGEEWTGNARVVGQWPSEPDGAGPDTPTTPEDNVWELVEETELEDGTIWVLLHEDAYRWDLGDAPVSIELFCEVRDLQAPPATEGDETEAFDGGIWYRYQQVDNQLSYPLVREDLVYATGEVAEDDVRYHQHVLVGDGRGLNVMTIMPDAFEGDPTQYDNVDPANMGNPPHDATIAMLGYEDKTTLGPVGPLDWDPATEQIVFPKEPGVRNVGELALVTVLGPREGASAADWTIAGAWQSASATAFDQVAEFQLNMGDAWLDPALAGTQDVLELHPDSLVPYPMVLMDRFTAQRWTEETERPEFGRFVPGTININTATRETLLAALPVPWDDHSQADRELRETIRRDIVDAILMYRDHRSDVPTGTLGRRPDDPDWRQDPGIRHIGEIYAATWHLFTENAGTGDTYEVGGVEVDRLANPGIDPAAHEPDEVEDDLEEKTLVLRMLSQLLTTRSDVFTAHILIRGYAFDDRSEPIVERRLLGVFDRGPVLENALDPDAPSDTTPRLLGVYRY
ncbi:MAG: hypothetical protein WD294_03150 [Phycisphaeraceae bacterium]